MSQPSNRKRKSNPFRDSHTPSKKQRKQPDAAKDESFTSDPSTLVAEEIPFTLECPVRNLSKRSKKQTVRDDVFGPQTEDGGFPNLKINYTIRPGKAWTDMKTYRNFSSTFKSMRIRTGKANTDSPTPVQNQKFSSGSLVYVNRHIPPPIPPDKDASEVEILAFDKKNLWVGQVLEVRAASPSQVLLRVFWLYWPEELPKGRRKYHGNQELIMSNHMEIVDAMTVASGADINRWDERIEDQDVGQRFWRQFYDVRLEKTKSGGLSAIREHCVCNGYYNPDNTMLKCPNSKCGIWNHEECLQDAILARTYGRLVGDKNSVKADPISFPASKMAQLKANVKSKLGVGHKKKGTTEGLPPLKNSTHDPSPWKGLFKAEIAVGEKGGKALVTITDERAQDPEVWTEGVQCLNCGTTMD